LASIVAFNVSATLYEMMATIRSASSFIVQEYRSDFYRDSMIDRTRLRTPKPVNSPRRQRASNAISTPLKAEVPLPSTGDQGSDYDADGSHVGRQAKWLPRSPLDSGKPRNSISLNRIPALMVDNGFVSHITQPERKEDSLNRLVSLTLVRWPNCLTL
jgi:hypothetical protein